MLVGMAPIGSLLIGAAAECWGAPIALMGGAAVCGLFALGGLWAAPQVRRME